MSKSGPVVVFLSRGIHSANFHAYCLRIPLSNVGGSPAASGLGVDRQKHLDHPERCAGVTRLPPFLQN